MKKARLLAVSVMAAVLLLVSGCSIYGPPGKELGEEFSLAIGDSVEIKGQDLQIELVEVIEDSRCPSGAECIWQGRVSVKVKIVYQRDSYEMVLIQYGLYEGYDVESYQDYLFTFKVEPYPELNKKIRDSEYRLLIKVSQR